MDSKVNGMNIVNMHSGLHTYYRSYGLMNDFIVLVSICIK